MAHADAIPSATSAVTAASVAKASRAPAGSPSTRARERGPAAEILVVDDAPENLGAIRLALDDRSVCVVVASSAQEALRHLLERNFDLILIDVHMPTVDGLEMARLIRQRERTRHVPIIFISEFEQHDEVLAAYRLGAVDFVSEPVEVEVLRAKASVFLERQRWRLEVAALRETAEEERARAEALTRTNLGLEHVCTQLEQSNARLVADDRRNHEFLAMLAHELRNPLAGIMSGIELLSIDRSPDKAAMARGIVRRQSNRLTRLVDDLADMSRIISGKMKLHMQLLSLDVVLEHGVALAEPELQGHALELAYGCRDVLVHGDPVRLARCFANLLTNAARYTPKGGRIRLSTGLDEDRWVRITVEDDGRGMSEELLSRAFDMFVQGVTGAGGLGIGLTLVRQISRMHGGEVTAHSDGPGRGSTFEIRLPVTVAGPHLDDDEDTRRIRGPL